MKLSQIVITSIAFHTQIVNIETINGKERVVDCYIKHPTLENWSRLVLFMLSPQKYIQRIYLWDLLKKFFPQNEIWIVVRDFMLIMLSCRIMRGLESITKEVVLVLNCYNVSVMLIFMMQVILVNNIPYAWKRLDMFILSTN